MTEKQMRFVDISATRWESWSGCGMVRDGCRSCQAGKVENLLRGKRYMKFTEYLIIHYNFRERE